MRTILHFASTDFGQHVTTVDLNDSIAKVKSSLGFLWKVPSEYLKLYYKTQEIEDARKLSYYGILSDSVLTVSLCKPTCRVRVYFPDGLVKKYHLDFDWTVQELKDHILEGQDRFQAEEVTLLFERRTIDYTLTVREAGIDEGSNLMVVLSLAGC